MTINLYNTKENIILFLNGRIYNPLFLYRRFGGGKFIIRQTNNSAATTTSDKTYNQGVMLKSRLKRADKLLPVVLKQGQFIGQIFDEALAVLPVAGGRFQRWAEVLKEGVLRPHHHLTDVLADH